MKHSSSLCCCKRTLCLLLFVCLCVCVLPNPLIPQNQPAYLNCTLFPFFFFYKDKITAFIIARSCKMIVEWILCDVCWCVCEKQKNVRSSTQPWSRDWKQSEESCRLGENIYFVNICDAWKSASLIPFFLIFCNDQWNHNCCTSQKTLWVPSSSSSMNVLPPYKCRTLYLDWSLRLWASCLCLNSLSSSCTQTFESSLLLPLRTIVKVTGGTDWLFCSNRTIPWDTLPTAAADGESRFFYSAHLSSHAKQRWNS